MNDNEIFGGYDPTEEAAAIRRLNQAGERNNDDETKGGAFARLLRLGKKQGFDPTDQVVQQIVGRDKK